MSKCHLTQKGLTNDVNVSSNVFRQQVFFVLAAISKSGLVPSDFHVNFMARGEPFLNPELSSEELYRAISLLIGSYWPGKRIEFKISTIVPLEIKIRDLPRPVDLYYSMYSTSNSFRKKWLPKAMPIPLALRHLKYLVDTTGSRLYIHHALIRGQNDSVEDAQSCIDEIRQVLTVDYPLNLNIVKFNTPDVDKWQETDDEQVVRYVDVWKQAGFQTQVVNRVGFDVAASCGMFIG